MIKDFLIKKMMEHKMKDLPKEQREMIETLLEKNPDLFMKMTKEVEHKVKKEGKQEMLAMMEVGKKYQKELREALGGK
jgi:succinate dehydrogenase flavin-adding protein (antitoxin of CptAB toxin-antitoxin module)